MSIDRTPCLTDNDQGEISVTLNGRELRGWSYANDFERRAKMLAAREYIEGWHDGRDYAKTVVVRSPAVTFAEQ